MTKSTDDKRVHIDDDEDAFLALVQKHIILYMGEARAKNFCGDCALATMATFCLSQIAMRESSNLSTIGQRMAIIVEAIGADAVRLSVDLAAYGVASEVAKAPKAH